jgi:hypothetical protein
MESGGIYFRAGRAGNIRGDEFDFSPGNGDIGHSNAFTGDDLPTANDNIIHGGQRAEK